MNRRKLYLLKDKDEAAKALAKYIAEQKRKGYNVQLTNFTYSCEAFWRE